MSDCSYIDAMYCYHAYAYILRSIEYEGFDNGLGELPANETVVIGEENAQNGMEKRRQIVLSHFTTATH